MSKTGFCTLVCIYMKNTSILKYTSLKEADLELIQTNKPFMKQQYKIA